MTFTHALATNNYGTAKFIVDASAANGTHTSIATALTSASSGDTIFIRPGTYTENLTLKAGVNLTAYVCDSTTPNVIISGTCTYTAAGTVSISGIRLQTNSAALLAITGSAASIVNLVECYLNCTNNTGITYSTANTSAQLTIFNCNGNLGTTGIGLFTHTSTGTMDIVAGRYTNSGASTTTSSCSTGSNANLRYAAFAFPFSATNSGNIFFSYCNINTSAQNATCFTSAGTGVSIGMASHFESGSASALSIGSGTTFGIYDPCSFTSSNTNAITGAGAITYGSLTFAGASFGNNITTQSAYVTQSGISRSTLQPAFLATHGVLQSNQTGAGAEATVNFTTEVFDQNSNYDGTNTFTAPITARYRFNTSLLITDAALSTQGTIEIRTSNRDLVGMSTSVIASSSYQLTTCSLADMDVADTCIVIGSVTGIAGNTADFPAAVTQTFFAGELVC